MEWEKLIHTVARRDLRLHENIVFIVGTIEEKLVLIKSITDWTKCTIEAFIFFEVFLS